MLAAISMVLVSFLFQVPPDAAIAAVEFVCPMDKDVRSKVPGKCPRCGMPLEAGVREPVEYQLGLKVKPSSVPAGRPVTLQFELREPATGRRAVKYEVMHEKLFHLFLISANLEHFQHVHPEPEGNGRFRLRTTLPVPGIYRVLADCYPSGATPQLLPAFLTTAAYGKSIGESIVYPVADVTPKKGENVEVRLRMDPPEPMPGRKTMMFFTFSESKGLAQYLGAWGHMMAVSSDLLDSIHEHPAFAEISRGDGQPEIQFNMFFPREGIYRVWVQFQRLGVVNTVAFTVPVREPR